MSSPLDHELGRLEARPEHNIVICRVVQMTQATGAPVRAPVDGDDCSVRVIDVDRVASTRVRVIDRDQAVEVADLFRLLGDPGRVRLLSALLEAGELCVCDLAAVVGMVESSVSHSLRLLRTAGVVRHRRAGRRVFYSLDDTHVRLLLDLSVAHVGHGVGE